MKKRWLLIFTLFLASSGFSQKVLTLEECRQMALDNNNSLLIAQENVKIAWELKKTARTYFLPSFTATGSYLWNQKNLSLLDEDAHLPIGKVTADGKFVPIDVDGNFFDPHTNPEKLQYALLPKSELTYDVQNVFVGAIGFTQPLYMGGKIREMNKMANYGENIAKISTENLTTEILMEIDEAYWRVVSLEAKVKLAKQYRELIAKVDSDMNYMMEQGVATRADQLKVKVKLNEADLTVTRAEDGLSLSVMVINQLCGMPMHEHYKLADVDAIDSVPVVEQISIEEAVEARHEIQLLQQMQNIANSNTKIAQSRFLPNVGLSGNYITTNPNSFDGFSNTFKGMFTVGVVASIPIFHFGERHHTLNSAKAQSRVVGLQMAEAREKIELQITQSSYKVGESLKKQRATQTNIQNAEENLRMAEEGYKEGVISSTDLLGAQSAWLAAKSDNIDANIDVRLCALYLDKAQGGTLQTK